jgi:hypothetical protein
MFRALFTCYNPDTLKDIPEYDVPEYVSSYNPAPARSKRSKSGMALPKQIDDCSGKSLRREPSLLDLSPGALALPPPPLYDSSRDLGHSDTVVLSPPLSPSNQRGQARPCSDEGPMHTSSFGVSPYMWREGQARSQFRKRVSFASSPTHDVHRSTFFVRPYSEIYDGVHPRDFNFDACGNKMPIDRMPVDIYEFTQFSQEFHPMTQSDLDQLF